MSHLRVLICRVEEENPQVLSEVAHFDLPEVDVQALDPTTALDDLEAQTQQTGHAILRGLLQAQWEAVDAALTDQYRQRFSPSDLSR
jgi:hypothetical protein